MLRSFGIGAKGLRRSTRRSDLDMLYGLVASLCSFFRELEGWWEILVAMVE
jgi:hypothetical protein